MIKRRYLLWVVGRAHICECVVGRAHGCDRGSYPLCPWNPQGGGGAHDYKARSSCDTFMCSSDVACSVKGVLCSDICMIAWLALCATLSATAAHPAATALCPRLSMDQEYTVKAPRTTARLVIQTVLCQKPRTDPKQRRSQADRAPHSMNIHWMSSPQQRR